MAKYKLEDICEFITDGTHQTPEYCENGGVMFLSSKDVTDRRINWDKVKYIPDALHEKLYKRLSPKKNDILLAKNGTTGVAAIVDRNVVFDVYVSLAVLRPLETIYPKYLLYAINSPVAKRQFDAGLKGIGVPNLHLGVIRNTIINIVSWEEQEKICKILDKVTILIDERKKELQLLDDLIKARFVEMFGDPYVNPLKWKKLKIKDAVTIEPQNGLYKPQSDYVTDGTGIPILRIDGFYDGMVTDFASLKRLKCSETERQRYLLLEDDIVINRVNSIEYLGKCAHIKELLEDTVYESNMMRMHFDPEYYNPVYICKLLCSQFIYDQIVNHAKKSVNQASINQKDVLDFNIYQPPLDLQNEFADFVHQVNKSKVAILKNYSQGGVLSYDN